MNMCYGVFTLFNTVTDTDRPVQIILKWVVLNCVEVFILNRHQYRFPLGFCKLHNLFQSQVDLIYLKARETVNINDVICECSQADHSYNKYTAMRVAASCKTFHGEVSNVSWKTGNRKHTVLTFVGTYGPFRPTFSQLLRLRL